MCKQVELGLSLESDLHRSFFLIFEEEEEKLKIKTFQMWIIKFVTRLDIIVNRKKYLNKK
jgi:hypothetical protein